jgi:hypothetical protein
MLQKVIYDEIRIFRGCYKHVVIIAAGYDPV